MLKKFLYAFWILVLFVFVLLGLHNKSYQTFIQSVENRTFDIRQSIQANSGVRKHNNDIVIVAIDDASYEYILENYGEWPLPRDKYAKIVDYIEQQKPQSVAFDLMFVKSMKSSAKSDEALINIFKKYNNIYTAMNLDDQPQDLRVAPKLPEYLQMMPFPDSMNPLEYSNCRIILQGILDAHANIGMINVSRSEDGVLRQMPVYLKYQGKYYPQLGYIVGTNYQKTKAENIYPLRADEDANVILNWYGSAGTFENIPMYKLLKAAEGKESLNYNFKGKVVYFGATAASLFDIKTVPVDKVFPGVEVQATYVNNIIDGSLIHKIPSFVNIILGLCLALLTVSFVIIIKSLPVALGLSVTTYFIYMILTYYLMLFKNLWVEIVSPLSVAFLVFIMAVIIKYLIKSRDFDEQYKLATTDGLTELYNHRYFQEQMQMFCINAKRYETSFSLIIIDIDHFKNFNDNFGHQSGDAVLRQVAFTLKKNVRASDIVCRYGGEEMAIILPNTANEEAVNIALKLCKIISEKKFQLSNNRESNVTISLGVSTYGEIDGTEAQELISVADKRLYNAKNNGRNRVN